MENIQLGGNIQLTGFKILNSGQLLIVKKMVGQHVRKLDAENPKSKRLHLTLKGVHTTEGQKPKKYEIKGLLDLDGKITQTELIDYNLFFALSNILNKLQ